METGLGAFLKLHFFKFITHSKQFHGINDFIFKKQSKIERKAIDSILESSHKCLTKRYLKFITFKHSSISRYRYKLLFMYNVCILSVMQFINWLYIFPNNREHFFMLEIKIIQNDHMICKMYAA